jgi:hypothetical protein
MNKPAVMHKTEPTVLGQTLASNATLSDFTRSAYPALNTGEGLNFDVKSFTLNVGRFNPDTALGCPYLVAGTVPGLTDLGEGQRVELTYYPLTSA